MMKMTTRRWQRQHNNDDDGVRQVQAEWSKAGCDPKRESKGAKEVGGEERESVCVCVACMDASGKSQVMQSSGMRERDNMGRIQLQQQCQLWTRWNEMKQKVWARSRTRRKQDDRMMQSAPKLGKHMMALMAWVNDRMAGRRKCRA